LDEVGSVQQQEKCGRKTLLLSAFRYLPSAAVCRLLSAVLLGVAIGACVHLPFSVTPNKPPVVQPETESLEDFDAREAERLLTADERVKLIAVTEMILEQHFTRPSAIEEEFRFQRRLAGINSPAFNAFVDKWTAKVEEMHLEDSVEALRKIYRSLHRGLLLLEAKNQEAYGMDQESEKTLLPSAVCGLPSFSLDSSELLLTPPHVEKQKPATQRQRLFR
jgi:hypothetical protein